MTVQTSVIIPVKNGHNFIKEAISSVLENIDANDEIIIIDDGSEDNTVHIIKEFMALNVNIHLFEGERLLPSGARNIGLEHAKGQYITFIDHDDLWPGNRLKRHINILNQDNNIDVVRGMVRFFSSDERKLDEFKYLPEDKSLYHANLGSFTFRKVVFERIGRFDSALKFGEDVDLFFKMSENQIAIHSDESVALEYRIHDTNMTHNKAENNNSVMFKALFNSIQRRRQSNNDNPIKPFLEINNDK